MPWPSVRSTSTPVAPLGRPDQAGAVIAVRGVDLGAVRKRQLEQASIVAYLARRDQIGTLLRLVLRVHVRASLDEQAGDVDVVPVGRGDERRCARGIARLDLRATPEQSAHLCPVPRARRLEQLRAEVGGRLGVAAAGAERAREQRSEQQPPSHPHGRSSFSSSAAVGSDGCAPWREAVSAPATQARRRASSRSAPRSR